MVQFKNMKAFAIVLATSAVISVCSSYSTDLISKTFRNISESLTKSNNDLSIVNYDSDDKLFDRLIPENCRNVMNINQCVKGATCEVKNSALVTVKSVNSLKEFNSKVKLTNQYPKELQFFVLFHAATVSEIVAMEETEILQFQYFLVEEEDCIKLLTFVWYTPEKCNEKQLIEVNKLDKKTEKWENKFSIIKSENFFGCQLVFGVPMQHPAFEYVIDDEDGSVEYDGYHLHLIEGLARILNYTVAFNPDLVPSTSNFYFKNLSVDLMVVLIPLNAYRHERHHVTHPYMFLDEFVAVPPGFNYTSYEKMLLPFDEHTWWLIIFTFVTAFVTIFVLNFSGSKIKNFVFGRNVETPSLNVTMIFCGISQVTLPKRNFARFIVMMFIIYSLIIRTAYQGKMFEFMQADMAKPGVQSIQEMMDNGLTLYVTGEQHNKLYTKMEHFKR